jgi:AcrR family transcriptional regulator
VKSAIVDRIFAKLLRDGLDDLGVDNLSEIGGVSKRTFYKYVETKEELLIELITRIKLRLGAHFDKYVNDTTLPPLEGIRQLFQEIPQIFVPQLRSFLLDLRRVRPDLTDELMAFRRSQIRRVASKLDLAARSGEIRSEIKTTIAMDALLAMFDQIITPDYLMQSGESMETLFDHVFDIFFKGIAAKDSRLIVSLKS